MSDQNQNPERAAEAPKTRDERIAELWDLLRKLPMERLLPIDDDQTRQRQAARLRRMIIMAWRTSKEDMLLKCSDESLASAASAIAELGLEPSMGQVWMLPRWDKDRGELVCDLQVGAYGYVELARRAGALHVWAEDVFSEDEYSYSAGSAGPVLEHRINLAKWDDRGELLGTYAFARYEGDERPIGIFMSAVSLAKAASKNPFSDRAGSVWKDWPDQMRRKSAIKRAAKLWPKSKEFAIAEDLDHKGLEAVAAERGYALPAAAPPTTPTQQLGGTLDQMASRLLEGAPSELAQDLAAAVKQGQDNRAAAAKSTKGQNKRPAMPKRPEQTLPQERHPNDDSVREPGEEG